MVGEQESFEVRRVVVGVDERELGGPALRAALDVAQRLGVRLELVHALEHLEATWIAADRELLAQLERAAEERARALIEPRLAELERERELAAGTLVGNLRVVPGSAGRVLCEDLAEGPDALVLLGPHQRRGWIDLGRTARTVLVGCRASVWVQPTAPHPLEAVVAAVDISPNSRTVLVAARELGRRLGVPVTCLHALVPAGLAHLHEVAEALALPRGLVERLRARSRQQAAEHLEAFDWQGVPHSLELVEEEPRAAIQARHGATRLVVLGTRAQAGLATLPGNVAWSVLRDARGPVLAVRQPAPRLVT